MSQEWMNQVQFSQFPLNTMKIEIVAKTDPYVTNSICARLKSAPSSGTRAHTQFCSQI